MVEICILKALKIKSILRPSRYNTENILCVSWITERDALKIFTCRHRVKRSSKKRCTKVVIWVESHCGGCTSLRNFPLLRNARTCTNCMLQFDFANCSYLNIQKTRLISNVWKILRLVTTFSDMFLRRSRENFLIGIKRMEHLAIARMECWKRPSYSKYSSSPKVAPGLNLRQGKSRVK